MSELSTRHRLVSRYNTIMGRAEALHARGRARTGRSLRRVLGSWLPERRDCRILDVGCGEGTLLSMLASEGYTHLDGFDLSPENVRICHQQGHAYVECFDALRADEFAPDRSFDLILAFDILEHLPKESAALFLDRLRSKLAEGGILVVQTPNMGGLFAPFYRYGDLSHEFGVTERTLAQLFVISGFQREDVSIVAAWNATTVLGRLREYYLRALHRAVFLADDSRRATIPSKNLLGVAVRRELRA